MKLMLTGQPSRPSGEHLAPENELLRLTAEILEHDGRWPDIDSRAAVVGHRNGRMISVAESEIAELMDRGLLDRDGGWTECGRAFVLFGLERYEEALECAGRAGQATNPEALTFAILAAALSRLGRRNEAHAAIADLLALVPDMSCAVYRGSFAGAATVMERLGEALADAGLPDGEPAPTRAKPNWNR